MWGVRSGYIGAGSGSNGCHTFMVVRNWFVQKILRHWPQFGKLTFICLVLGLSLGLWHSSTAQAQLDTLTVAVSLAPPFAFVDETGTLTGFDIELLDALATQAGLRFTYATTELRYLLPGVVTRLYDIGDCIVITPERQAQLLFTQPYFASGLTLVAQKDNRRIQTLTDLTAEKSVGVLDGSLAVAFAQTHVTATVYAVQSTETLFAKIETGELNSALISEAELLAYQLDHPETTLHGVGDLLTYGECGMAVNQADTALLEKLDAALTELKNNGTYATIYKKWFGNRPQPEKPVKPTSAREASAPPTPTPTAVSVEVTRALTTETELAGLYYLTISPEATPQPTAQTANQYQLLTLAPNGLWFVMESPVPLPDNAVTTMQQNGQSGLWYVNSDGQVEATLLTFTTSSDATPTAVIRKDYQMQIDSNGHVVGRYQAAYYAADLFTSLPPPAAAMTQTVEFTGERVR